MWSSYMDELKIYSIMFPETDKVDDTAVFKTFVKNILIVATPRVRDIIINFKDTLTTLLSSSNENIDSLVRETHKENSVKLRTWKLRSHKMQL